MLILTISFLILTLGLIILKYQNSMSSSVSQKSNYEIYSREPLNQQEDYYSNQANSPDLYQPIEEWTGRFILPFKEQRQASDSVLLGVYNTTQAHQHLIGKIVNLKWSDATQIQAFVQAVT